MQTSLGWQFQGTSGTGGCCHEPGTHHLKGDAGLPVLRQPSTLQLGTQQIGVLLSSLDLWLFPWSPNKRADPGKGS